jgi:hypothetical protein
MLTIRIIAVGWDPIFAHLGNFWQLLDKRLPAVQHVIMHADDENPEYTPGTKFIPRKGRIPMIIPTRRLESLDMHICPMISPKLKEIPVEDRPEVRHLVLRRTSRANAHTPCGSNKRSKAVLDVLNRTIRRFRSIRTLCIHEATFSPSAPRLPLNPYQWLELEDLPDLEVLTLKRSYRVGPVQLPHLLSRSTEVSNKMRLG